MRIGIIGSGMIGSTLGRLWAHAGHEVFFSSRHPENLQALVAEVGAQARCGPAEEAAAFGEAALLAIPFGAVTDVGPRLAPHLQGKVVLDAGNPYVNRDGAAARRVQESGKGSGVFTAQHLPSARVVKAFNTVYFETLAKEAHRSGARIGIPLAADDGDGIEVAARLVRDAGFDPVVVGLLEAAARYDPGTPVWNSGMSGPEIRQALGLGTP
jgi:8-hydroxy-5-deazaflavin:NADPH oxidoreductase